MPKQPSDLPEGQITPSPELEKRSRRVFSTDYKLRILAEADQCQHGELGALLRKEKLYSNQLQQWRREFKDGGSEKLAKSAPGPRAAKTPEQRRIEQFEQEIARLTRRLQVTEDCVALQKKPSRCSITRTMGAMREGGASRPSASSAARQCLQGAGLEPQHGVSPQKAS